MSEKTIISSDLPGIVLLSHGTMCRGMMESAEMIVGGTNNNVYAFPFLSGDDFTAYADKVLDLYFTLPEGSIILFDLFGGTPFNQVIMACARRGKMIHGMCGYSLPVLVEAISQRDTYKGDELIEQLKSAGEVNLVDVNKYLSTLIQSN